MTWSLNIRALNKGLKEEEETQKSVLSSYSL